MTACEPVPDLEALLKPSTALLLGEIHGTTESPAFVAATVCLALRSGRSVTAGLEIPYEDQPGVETYLHSGTDADRAAMFASPFWTAAYQDGRRSKAMAAPLLRLREFTADRLPVHVAFFDRRENTSAQARDEWMAQAISTAHRKAPADLIVALAGNRHTRVEGTEPVVPMGVLLGTREPALPRTSLNVGYSGGSAWTCTGAEAGSCGARELKGRPIAAKTPAVHMFDTRQRGYDGEDLVGSITASPPAIRSPNGEPTVMWSHRVGHDRVLDAGWRTPH